MQPERARILVTGAAGCLGRAIAQDLRNAGARVAGFDRDETALAEVDLDFAGACDLTDAKATAAAFDALCAAFGGVEVLVNAAGRIVSGGLVNLLATPAERRHSAELWNDTIAANLTAVFHISALAAERMLLDRVPGVIINISSVVASGNAGQSAYSAAKAGVDALTCTWARELGSAGIRVVGIAPGFIATQSTADALGEPHIGRLIRTIPLRRLGTTADVVRTVRFAIENDYLSGSIVGIHGGLS